MGHFGTEKLMKNVSKSVLAASAITCATLLSFNWSGSSVSLSVEGAQARAARAAMPMTATSAARRHARRGYYGTAAAVGAGVAAVGTAAAVAAGSPYWGSDPYYTGTGYYAGGRRYHGAGYYSGGPYAAYGSYGYPAEDYATRNGFVCHPGGTVKLEDGRTYPCQ